MNKLPENSDQTKNVKKSPSITRIATRGIINIFVPLMETRLITNSVQHMLEQQKRRLDRFRQVNNKKAQLHLTWEEALQASHMSVDDLDRRFRRRRTVWRFCCWSLLAIAFSQWYALCRLFITSYDSGTRHQHSCADTVRRRSLCFQSTDCYIPPLAVA